ncbi:DUF1993 domain-containing protein [Pseudorhodoplanes sinuspersici]|uniref:Uncharacterized protein n=1 Tax=Pseudorhodoplanes sinuspersici TaxID=1235591 RepID=A0A1W6ZMM3_9HYPH|nr:DUF1993 domain-containing protein [Pseudorhodoplanes sinuspersici]ARP98636.1 hypothetical protein CAK95_05730 [Pseudorhodoplanes sinuspersici]RKE69777.1 hypothetical protein DFP91_4219 [Pseudorhodoplanes sinuspersici]
MPISIYQASVPVFVRGLTTLSHVLRKGEAHARDTGADPVSFVEARLASDMLTLAGQVQRASDTSKLAMERITGTPSPKLEDDEKTFAELYTRIDRTITYIDGFKEAQLDGLETRTIELKLRDFTPAFSGSSYLFTFALPNFFFHVTTAYDILRHKGVPLSKMDYLRLKD